MGNKYLKPFLKSVIIRIDFVSHFRKGNDELSKELKTELLRFFPILEPRTFISGQVEVKRGSSKQMIEEGTNWLFHGIERDKTLSIGTDHFDISYNKYESFDSLFNDFRPITVSMYNAYRDLQAIRFGLRYINNIELEGTDVFEWTNYLNKALLKIFDIPEDKQTICRAFHNLTMNYGDMILTFQYGMHNPDFPAPIRKKIFVLDYDAYYHGLQEMDDVLRNTHEFHDRIEKMFESSISQRLRVIMGVVKNG
jgi:uncharacterized protein (TIGR04255 family)